MPEEIQDQSYFVNFREKMLRRFSISEAIQKLVLSCKEPDKQELLYLCAVERMQLSELSELVKLDSREISVRRQEFLRRYYTDTSVISKDIIQLQKKVQDACKSSTEIREEIESSVRLAIESQKEAMNTQKEMYQKSIAEKEEVIRLQEEKIKELKARDAPKPARQRSRNIEVPLPKEKTDSAPVQQNQQKHVDTKAKENTEETAEKSIHESWWKRYQRRQNIQKFISLYLNDSTYDESQQEYLISCLEDGDAIKDIQNFASPDLSVNQMKRIREIRRSHGI